MTAKTPADAVREALDELIELAYDDGSIQNDERSQSVTNARAKVMDMFAALTARVAEQTVQRDGWHRRVHELEAQLLEWLHANGPGGWIDDLRQRATAAEETKLTAINGLARIASAAIKERP